MSTKNGKRSRRKTEEEIIPSQDFKTPINKKDKAEDSMKMKIDQEEDLKGFDNENGTKEEEGIKTRSRSNTPQNIKKTPTKSTPEKEPEIKEASPLKQEVAVEPQTESKLSEESKDDDVKTMDEKPTQSVVNGTDCEKEEVPLVAESAPTTEPTKTVEAQDLIIDEVEMEPLIVDQEAPDPELQFDESSDIDSRKGSPVLSRCRTRRSQTRNIPTPKTPKSIIDQNGDDKDSDKTLSQTPEVPEPPDNVETESESSQKTEETDQKPETISIDLNETRESFESCVSMKVNVGGDLTREIDLTIPDDKDSFLNTAKDLTVVETIRRMSSRRAIRPAGDYRKILLKAKAEKKQEVYSTLQVARTSVERLTGTKRKGRGDTPDGTKRFKLESSPGFMSYISSPLNRIKNKFTPGEVSASTPKLTSYRKQDILEDANISKIENEVNPTPEKKWCSIM